MRLSNTNDKRRGYEQVENEQNFRVLSSEKMEKNHPMVPPLDHFQGKNENLASLARMISALRRSFL